MKNQVKYDKLTPNLGACKSSPTEKENKYNKGED